MESTEFLQIRNNLLYAARETLLKQGIELTLENYCNAIKRILTLIIENNSFGGITRNNGARELISGYTSIVILSYLAEEVALFKNVDFSEIAKSLGERKLDYMYVYANDVLPRILSPEWLKQVPLSLDDSIGKGLREIHFNTPSNACREAVIRGEQMSVRTSEAHVRGLNAYSSIGRSPNQEDSYYVGEHPLSPDVKLMIVADGMGGVDKGEYASNFAVKELVEWFEKLPLNAFRENAYDATTGIKSLLTEKVKKIDKDIKERFANELRPPGTTLCMVISNGTTLTILNIGDSKGFILENYAPLFITTPDNFPNKVWGVTDPFDRFHAQRNQVTNCLGGVRSQEPTIEPIKFIIRPGSRYDVVLCSDGVTDSLSNKEVVNIISSTNNLDEAVRTVLDRALNKETKFSQAKREAFGLFGYIFPNKKNKPLVDLLKEHETSFSEKIKGGRDNATIVSGTIVRGGNL